MANIPLLKPVAAAKKLGITLEELDQLRIKKVAKLGSNYYEIRDVNRYMAKQRGSYKVSEHTQEDFRGDVV